MVASVDVTATQVGVDILKEGGNAVDAAVAVGYALAVTHPQAGNLGGGGFMLIRSKNGNTTAIDFREMAPAKATRDMFLDDQGNPDSKKSLTSHLASGTPGTVAGFWLALDKYGTMPLNKVVQPAFKLARDGFIVNDALADDLKTYGSEVLPNHENSKAIFWKEGEPLKKGGKTDDFFFLEADGDAAQKLVCDLVTTRLPRSYQFDPVKDIQVLCPTKLGPTGTQALNAELQAMLNPPKKGKPELQSAARVFRVGDKVMQVRNNYEITWQRIGGEQGVGAYNGDIGIVESIDVRIRSMVVRMDDRRLVYPAENLNELEIAYAITVHKSQGSEFPAVILPAAQVPPRLCYRNLFYTGVTRGRKLCIVVGRRDVVNRMMSNIRQNLRYSGLAALLAQALPPEQENLSD